MEQPTPPGFEPIDLGAGFARLFGPVWLCQETCSLGFRVQEHHLNPAGFCNGGAMATFADMQIVAVVAGAGTTLPHAPTISLSIDYLNTAPCGAWVEAAAVLLRKTRTMVFTQALITVDGDPVARTHAIYRHYGT